MLEALDRNYYTTNATRLHQLLRQFQAISTLKKGAVMEKHEAVLNPNAEIRVQKPELAFGDNI